MKILVIEDDDNKRQQLVDFIMNLDVTISVTETRSYHSGLKALLASEHDVVFLDMTMPTFDRSPIEGGGRIRPFAGRDILAQIDSRDVFSYVVVFTQFELLGDGVEEVNLADLDVDLSATFPRNYRGFVHYDTAQNDWKVKIREIIGARARERDQ